MVPHYFFQRQNQQKRPIMRRAIDILFSAAALVLLAPFLVLLAIAIRMDSRGNPIYFGRRVGLAGREFRIWKFRTMLDGAEHMGAAITNRNDPRVTRLGRLLRQTKIDELPQFVNVLLGDMTLVGPRPEAPAMVAEYSPEQMAVLQVRPGITGYGQLQAGDEEEQIPEGAGADAYYRRYILKQKVEQDLKYLKARTFWSDLRIVLATAGIVFRTKRRTKTSDQSQAA